MDKKITARQLGSFETKRKIYESAEWLFTKNGFESVSVDSIVERAGVAKGSFYVHYKSKNTLIMAIIQNYVSTLDADYLSYYESLPENIKSGDALLALVNKIIDIMVNTIGYESIRMIYQVHVTRNVDTSALLDYSRELYSLFIHIINKGVVKKEFKYIISADQLARHFVYIIRGYVYEWCIRYPNFDIKAETLMHFQILLEGLYSDIKHI